MLGTSLWTGEHLQQQLLHDSHLKGQKAAEVLLPCLYLVLWGQTWYFRSKSFPVVFSSQIPTVRTSDQHPRSPGRTKTLFLSCLSVHSVILLFGPAEQLSTAMAPTIPQPGPSEAQGSQEAPSTQELQQAGTWLCIFGQEEFWLSVFALSLLFLQCQMKKVLTQLPATMSN